MSEAFEAVGVLMVGLICAYGLCEGLSWWVSRPRRRMSEIRANLAELPKSRER